MDVEVRHLRAFLAVWRSRSFTPLRAPADHAAALASVRSHVTVRLGFSWLLPDPWAQQAVGQFEQATGATVSLVRCDDPLAAIEQASIDVAVIRGAFPDSPRCAGSICSTRCG